MAPVASSPCCLYILADLVTAEPWLFVTTKGEAMPFFKEVATNLIHSQHALHNRAQVHGNLKPELIDVTRDGQARLRGPIITLRATRASPSYNPDEEYSRIAYDLGKVLYFCLTGRHEVAWQPDMQELVGMRSMDTQAHLIKQLVGPKAYRPSMQQALRHPCLWDDRQCAGFLVYVSNYLKKMCKDFAGLPYHLHQCLQGALQKGTQLWSELIHEDLMQELHSFFKHLRTDSWLHLLHCFRNLHNHHRQVYNRRPALRHVIGCTDVGAYRYFAARFPKLLITTYSFVQACCMEDPEFTSGLVVDVCMTTKPPQAVPTNMQDSWMGSVSAAAKLHYDTNNCFQDTLAARKLNVYAECFTPSQVSNPSHGPAVQHIVPKLVQGHIQTSSRPVAAVTNTLQQTSWNVGSAASANCGPSYACVARTAAKQESLPDSSASSVCSDCIMPSRVSSCTSSQASCDSHWVASQLPNSRRRLNQHATGSAEAHSQNSLVKLQSTAYSCRERKAAVQRYENGDRTVLGAACIGRCYELGSGGFVRIAYALDWYHKAITLCEEGAFKTYLLMRITDLQQQPKRGAHQSE